MTAPSPSEPLDPRGHDLLDRRVAAVWPAMRSVLATPVDVPAVLPSAGVVVTGVGSSEAHGRYLVGLLNEWTPVPAEFVALGAFADAASVGPSRRTRALVVFSQGLAPNAQLALHRVGEFSGTVLFTSATETGQLASGRPERAELLARLVRGGARIERFPVEDEYTLLVRLIGPACGFAAARRFAAAVPGSRLPPASSRIECLQAVAEGPWPNRVATQLRARVEEHGRGFVLVTPASVSGCAQNLAAKFVEGLYWPPPHIVETLELAHGTFQQLLGHRSPAWVLSGDPLSARAVEMLAAAGLDPFEVPLGVPADVAPLAVELLFNEAIARLVSDLGIDQVNWPGRGLDEVLYGYSGSPSR